MIDDSDDSESDDAKPKAAPTPKTPAKAAPAKAAESSEDDDDDDDDDSSDPDSKAVLAKSTPAKSTPAKGPLPRLQNLAKTTTMNLRNLIQSLLPQICSSKVYCSEICTRNRKKVSSSSSSSEDSSDEEADPAPVAKAAATKAGSSDSDEDDSSEDDDVEMKDGTSAPTPAKSAKRKADAVDSTTLPAKKAKTNGEVSAAAATPGTEDSTTIFVANLAYSVDDEQLKTEFSSFGEVLSARVPTDRNTGRARGIGYVEFAERASALAAVAETGKEIMGREVRIDLSGPRVPSPEKRAKAFNDEASPPSAVLFIGNLDFNCTEDGVWEAFGDFGEIVSVRLPTDRETQRPKGFGYVEFADQATAVKAFEGMQGQELLGRALRLDYSQPRDSQGGSRGGGRGFGGDRGGRGGGRGGFGDRGGRGGRGGFGDRGAVEGEEALAIVEGEEGAEEVATVVSAAEELPGAEGKGQQQPSRARRPLSRAPFASFALTPPVCVMSTKRSPPPCSITWFILHFCFS
ncbi:hypothetical protein BS47DRAFT_1375325 [Hydnum rufescens UP504]|uniref:RRM domain-containing protein n=1 Tax=Hydnum rufescens UP504 TaxID=1448309 RepID=A0A9P6DYE4_9AGAM|nr:hypothetical protein BS47DRAFT_1375325 [Hydnum rufescens UP504]